MTTNDNEMFEISAAINELKKGWSPTAAARVILFVTDSKAMKRYLITEDAQKPKANLDLQGYSGEYRTLHYRSSWIENLLQ